MAAAAILDFIELKIAPLVSAVLENPILEPNMEWIGHLKCFQDGGGFFELEIAPLDPPSMKTPP